MFSVGALIVKCYCWVVYLFDAGMTSRCDASRSMKCGWPRGLPHGVLSDFSGDRSEIIYIYYTALLN